jgi:hypothetical protein
MTYRRQVHPAAAMLLVACTILFYPTGSYAQDTKGRDIVLPQIGTGSVDA